MYVYGNSEHGEIDVDKEHTDENTGGSGISMGLLQRTDRILIGGTVLRT